MDRILIPQVLSGRLRIDIPSERLMTALAWAWNDGRNHQITFVDGAASRRAATRPEYRSMLASSDLALPQSDSFLKTILLKSSQNSQTFRDIPIPPEHAEYISWIEEDDDGTQAQAWTPLKALAVFLSAIEPRRGSVFLIGGGLRSLQKAEANLRATFPSLRLVGRAEGELDKEDEPAVMRALQKAAPDFIIVGSRIESGELWIPRHFRYTKSGIFMYGATIIETLAGSRFS